MVAKSAETICALSTGAGRAALAVVRVSGPEANSILKTLIGDQVFPEVRAASLKKLFAQDGSLIDEAVITRFEAPNTYTGEDLVEFSVHGNPLICERLLSELVSRGTRPAKPGEFSLRAVLNSRMSLHELEALDLMLNGQTEEAVRMGVRAKLGDFSDQASAARDKLIELSAKIEAQLDFGEAESGGFNIKDLQIQLVSLRDRLAGWLKSYERAQSYLKRMSIALVGRPNVGKSSLFNALIGEGRALVHEEPGTTRDYLEVELKIGGRYALLFDTAGIREAANPVERLGIEKTKEAISRSDVILWISDVAEEPSSEILSQIGSKRLIRVRSKSDLSMGVPNPGFVSVSSLRGDGLERLFSEILGGTTKDGFELSPIVSDREERILKMALSATEEILQSLEAEEFLELTAEKLRILGGHLEEVLGRVPHDELLRNILGRFCIGK